MQVYKIRDFYYKFFIGMAVLLAVMFLFASNNLGETPLVLMVLPFIMVGRVFSLCDREILFLKDNHLEWDSGMGQALAINYDTILKVNISSNLKTAKLELKDGDKIKSVTLFLSYLGKEVRPEIAEFLKSKSMRLAAANVHVL